jgi:hypothetical protein
MKTLRGWSALSADIEKRHHMSIKDDIAKIPRKNKNGLGDHKTVTSVNIDPAKLELVRSIARVCHVSISGVIELALDRLFAEIDREAV